MYIAMCLNIFRSTNLQIQNKRSCEIMFDVRTKYKQKHRTPLPLNLNRKLFRRMACVTNVNQSRIFST